MTPEERAEKICGYYDSAKRWVRGTGEPEYGYEGLSDFDTLKKEIAQQIRDAVEEALEPHRDCEARWFDGGKKEAYSDAAKIVLGVKCKHPPCCQKYLAAKIRARAAELK